MFLFTVKNLAREGLKLVTLLIGLVNPNHIKISDLTPLFIETKPQINGPIPPRVSLLDLTH